MNTAPSFMRTAVISRPRTVELREIDVPRPKSTEILVKLQGCGVCGSNVPVWEGRSWFQYPLEAGAPGHEGWGVIEQVGSEIKKFSVGERVAFLSGHAFADYDIVSEQEILCLPVELSSMPFPAEPLGCAMNVFQRSTIREGDRVAIIGIGFLGAVLTRLITNTGAQVTAISRRATALQIAEMFGATNILRLQDYSEVAKSALHISGGKGYDCVIEAVGQQETLDLATQLTKERGRLVIAGYHQDGLRQINMQLWNWRGLDVINAHERDSQVYLRGMQKAVDAVLHGDLDPTLLYTHTYSLENLSDALEMTCHREEGFLKALVML